MTEAPSQNQPDGPPARRHFPAWVWAIAVAGMLLAFAALALFVPPFALAQRLGGAYVTLNEAEPATFHPDGLLVTLAEGSQPVEVQVSTIPREAFLADDAGRVWEAAHAALPAYLTPLSPIYSIRLRGAGRVIAQLAVPNDAEPLERLDLYAWDSQAARWVFVPSQIDLPGQMIVFWPTSTLLNVIAVHAGSTTPVGGVTVSRGGAGAGQEYDIALPEGVFFGETGALGGTPAETSARQTLPLVENRRGPADYSSADWQARAAELLGLAEPYDGLTLDFSPGEGYAAFVAALAGELHAQGKALGVVVRPDELDQIDLALVGQAADRVWLAPGPDPAAYLEDGATDRALATLVGLVPRDKAGLLASGLTVDSGPSGSTPLSFEQVGALFGSVEATPGYMQPGTSSMALGSILPLRLSGRVESTGYDPALGASYLTYHDEAGGVHYVVFGSAQALSRRLEWARRYALGGVAAYGLGHPAAPDGLADGLGAFLAELPAQEAPQLRLVWQVQGPSGEVVAEAEGDLALLQYVWQGTQEPGQYTVRALLRVGASKVELGQLAVEVRTPEEGP